MLRGCKSCWNALRGCDFLDCEASDSI
jgi:hypothetical protein